MKKIFLVASNGFAARNFFRTGLLKNLLNKGIHCVLVFNNALESSFREEFKNEKVSIENLKIDSYKAYSHNYPLARYFNYLRKYLYNGTFFTQTIADYESITYIREKNFFKKMLLKLRLSPLFILKKSKILRLLFAKLESKIFIPEIHHEIFKKYNPEAVIVSSPGTLDFDHYFLRESNAHGCKTISIIQSWDNTSSKGYPGYVPDLIFAWTDAMKKELINFSDIDGNKIIVGGVAHFDHYFNNSTFISKSSFFKMMDLDPSKKTIFYASRSPSMYPWNPEIVEVLAKAINSNKFSIPTQLIVRVHPNHFVKKHFSDNLNYSNQDRNMDDYINLEKKYKNLKFNYPNVIHSSTTSNNSSGFDINFSEVQILSSLLKHSDLVINLFSTINIEASIFDLPIINIGFNGKSNYNNVRHDIRIDERQYHNQRALQTGAIIVSRNPKNLIDDVERYLANPSLDEEKRMVLKDNECGLNLGNSSVFISEKIIKFIDNYK